MIEVALNDVLPDGTRRLRLVGDVPLDAEAVHFTKPIVPSGAGVCVRTWRDELLGLFYVEWTWACMEMVECTFEGDGRMRRLAVWKFLPGERVSEVVGFVAEWYFAQTRRKPQYAWMQKLPQGAEYGVEVGGVMLLEVSWALPGCVMIGG